MRTILVVLVFALIAVSVSAQRIIPKAGMSLFQASIQEKYPEYNDVKPKIGFTVGIAYEIPLKGSVLLQPEINFIQKGFVYEQEEIDEGGGTYMFNQYSLRLNYIEVPVLVKVKLKASKFYFLAGPSIGYGINGTLKQEYEYTDPPTHLQFTQSSDVKFEDLPDGYTGDSYEYVNNRVDVGLQFGGGIELFDRIQIEARFGLGLTRLYDDRSDIYQFDHAEQTKNRVVQFTIGMPLQVGK